MVTQNKMACPKCGKHNTEILVGSCSWRSKMAIRCKDCSHRWEA